MSMLKVSRIIDGSPADNGRIEPGDELISLDGNPVNDVIDYRFYQADSHISIALKRGRRIFKISLAKNIDKDMGLEFPPDKIIRCNNKCIFCFCHNNPKHLRRTLYIKDDDYRQSFLNGNFITLTNLSESDIARIIKMRLTPLYISVQATDDDVRQKLFGRRHVRSVLPILYRLAENRIFFHCQVVIVPGFNDGEILYKTVMDLAELRPYAASLAIVPVGLTKYSNPQLKPVTPGLAKQLIETVHTFRRKYGNKQNHFAYAADELFIKADIDIPGAAYYDDSPQIENGVGMVRDFLDTVPDKTLSKVNGIWITGSSMIKIWRKYIIPKLKTGIKLAPVNNDLFGKRVTVTGLLSGNDIVKKLSAIRLKKEPVVLPPNCLNSDGIFLDNLTVPEMESRLKTPVVIGSYSFKETLRML